MCKREWWVKEDPEQMTREEVDRIHNRDFNHLFICLLSVPLGLGFMYALGMLKQAGWFF